MQAIRYLGEAVLAATMTLAAAQIQSAAAQNSTAPPAPAQAQPTRQIEPKAMAILHAACDKLNAAQTMSFTAVNTYEHAARNGQPLYYAVENQVTLQRPNKLRVITLGDGTPDEFYYDGKTMMAYVPSQNLTAVADAPPTIEQALDAAWNLGAIYFPFDDVIVKDPCAVFDKNVTSAFYVGQSVVIGGTTTDMVAVASDDVQGEIWIGAQDHLPRLIRVVYPHEPAHALYQTAYSDWQLNGAVDPGTFASAKAATAARVDFAPPAARQPPQPGEPPAKKP